MALTLPQLHQLDSGPMTKIDNKYVERFEKIEAQLSGFYDEVQTLAKKSPDGAMNRFKLGYINATLQTANDILTKEQRPLADFATFNVDDLPTNSDVLFILKQYANCLEEVRSDHIAQDYEGRWYWTIDGKHGDRARPPSKLGDK